jgi:hypothetical protein
MKKSEFQKLVREEIKGRLAEASTPSDVAYASKVQGQAKSVGAANKRIDQQSEFAGSFENWFSSLGYKSGKISKSVVLREVGKVLDKLGYR